MPPGAQIQPQVRQRLQHVHVAGSVPHQLAPHGHRTGPGGVAALEQRWRQFRDALEVLNHMAGDCTEHSILFIGLARAAGLPAREVAGMIYVTEDPAGFYFHQWAKVWVGKWIDVDPNS